MNIKQRAAFAEHARKQEQQAKKNNKKGKRKLTPVSRKGKSKFRY